MTNTGKLREAVEVLTPLGFRVINPSAYYMYADLYDKEDLENVLHVYIQGNVDRFSDYISWILEIAVYNDADGWNKQEFKKAFGTLDDLLEYLTRGGQ